MDVEPYSEEGRGLFVLPVLWFPRGESNLLGVVRERPPARGSHYLVILRAALYLVVSLQWSSGFSFKLERVLASHLTGGRRPSASYRNF